VAPTVPAKLAGMAPIEGSGIFVCPIGMHYAAYADGKVYPPNHPRLPQPSVRPARCFTTEEEAIGAGYAIALAPPGYLVVDGVYLGSSDPQLQVWCRNSAARLGFAVWCPERLPNPGWGADGCGSLELDPPPGTCVFRDAFFLELRGFPAPPEYGVESHFVMTAFRADEKDSRVLTLLGCSNGAVVETSFSLVPEEQASFIDCPSGTPPLGGHLILRWPTSPGAEVVWQVSLHGDTPINRSLLMAIAAHIVYVDAG